MATGTPLWRLPTPWSTVPVPWAKVALRVVPAPKVMGDLAAVNALITGAAGGVEPPPPPPPPPHAARRAMARTARTRRPLDRAKCLMDPMNSKALNSIARPMVCLLGWLGSGQSGFRHRACPGRSWVTFPLPQPRPVWRCDGSSPHQSNGTRGSTHNISCRVRPAMGGSPHSAPSGHRILGWGLPARFQGRAYCPTSPFSMA